MSNPNYPPEQAFTVGSKVVIRFNPHRGHTGLVGEVIKYEKGAGFQRCDLVTVRYTNPEDGSIEEFPFAPYNLMAGGPEELIAMAERHEEQAEMLRRMADGQ